MVILFISCLFCGVMELLGSHDPAEAAEEIEPEVVSSVKMN